MKYTAICFDLDGVIIDSEPLHEVAFRKTLSHYSLPLPSSDYMQYFAGKSDYQGFADYLSSLRIELPLQELLILKQQNYIALAPNELTYYEGMPLLIQSLASAATLALVTGSSREETNLALQKHHLHTYFTAIVTADDITNSKPSPEGYLLAAKRLGDSIAPNNCIAVEDSPSGVQAAKQAGMYCVAITTTHSADELQAADTVVDKLTVDSLSPLLSM